MTKYVDRRASSSAAWLQQLARRPKPQQLDIIGIERMAPDRPSKVQQQKPRETWDVVVRDWQGGEFCRRSFPTREAAEKSEAALRRLLAGCGGEILGTLSAWARKPVHVPVWWS